MKSAYEIALERMQQDSGPSKSLSEDQRRQIADIDNKYEAKIAEERLKAESKIATAEYAEREQLQQQLMVTIKDLEEKRDAEKDNIWQNAG